MKCAAILPLFGCAVAATPAPPSVGSPCRLEPIASITLAAVVGFEDLVAACPADRGQREQLVVWHRAARRRDALALTARAFAAYLAVAPDDDATASIRYRFGHLLWALAERTADPLAIWRAAARELGAVSDSDHLDAEARDEAAYYAFMASRRAAAMAWKDPTVLVEAERALDRYAPGYRDRR